MNGSYENATLAYKIKSKNSFKLTVIINKEKLPFSFVLSKGTAYDGKITLSALENFIIPVGFSKYNNITLAADGGYLTKSKKSKGKGKYKGKDKGKNKIPPCKKKYNVDLLIKPRSNAVFKPVLSDENQRRLDRRVYVEHFFSRLKRNYIQVTTKYAAKIENYLSFLYFASLNIGCQIIFNDSLSS
jgi:hypothetical protein